jgi:hypothetical protein
VNAKEFNEILKTLATKHQNLVILYSTMGNPSAKGLDAELVDDGEKDTLTMKELKIANAAYNAELMDLKNYMRVSKKKQRTLVEPSSFTGTYIPAYAGEALRYFYNHGDFGYLDPSQPESSKKLMDSLPLVKKGFMLRNVVTMLFYINIYTNDLQVPGQGQFTKPDAVFKAAFSGKIPATFYSRKDAKGEQVKMLMERAVLAEDAGGLGLKKPMNTFSIITAGLNDKSSEKNVFNENKMNVYFYQSVASLNYSSAKNVHDAIELFEYLDDEKNVAMYTEILDHLGDGETSFRQQMLKEHEIIKATSRKWKEYKKKQKMEQKGAAIQQDTEPKPVTSKVSPKTKKTLK